ncbi:dihydropteroate synthase [Puteibacter caeruleilacunae]|nr:dihydropteroate synthase [Puteibacter caeruleilacunae]
MLVRKEGLNREKRKKTINYRGTLVSLDTPLVMGILNVTPDSFYDGGRYRSEEEMEKQIAKMVTEGADIIDVGAYSSRPGADDIEAELELERMIPAIKLLRNQFPDVMISIDTFRSSVARKIVEECGECIINDISGGALDDHMFETVADLRVPYIMMHMKGTPQNMQQEPSYENIVREMCVYFSERVNQLHRLGVSDVILDPGFGFAKTLDHNYELMNNLDAFDVFRLPILAGVSRKSMIYRLLGSEPSESLNGTTVLNTMALLGGADILRVHDVREAVEAVKIVEKLKSSVI